MLHQEVTLVFECCRTGREYRATSREWSTWLKMLWVVFKASGAVLDMNPVGLVVAADETVRDLYNLLKSSDDASFDVFMKKPFLSSEEQDFLVGVLEAEGIFEKISYDAQMADWYLNHPSRDGSAPPADVIPPSPSPTSSSSSSSASSSSTRPTGTTRSTRSRAAARK